MADWREQCRHAYAEHCAAQGIVPTEAEQQAWLEAWAQLEAEDRATAAETYWAEQWRYFAEGV